MVWIKSEFTNGSLHPQTVVLEDYQPQPEVVMMDRAAWEKLQDLCGNFRDTLNVMRMRYGMGTELDTLHQSVDEILAFMTSESAIIPSTPPQPLFGGPFPSTITLIPEPADVTRVSAPTAKPKNPPPLQRPRINFKKKKPSSDDEPEIQIQPRMFMERDTKKRRQRAKAAPSEEQYCRLCGETQTCEWRRGPDGYKSLCNACGIHYAKIVKKEESAQVYYKPKALNLNMLLNNDSSPPPAEQ